MPFEFWDQVKQIVTSYFTSPLKLVILLLTSALLTCLVCPRLWRKQIAVGTAVVIAIYLFLVSPIGANLTLKGLTTLVPKDTGQPADTIVILARGYLSAKLRTETAAQMWLDQRSPKILVSGRQKYVDVLMDNLIHYGVAANALIAENEARTTEENAVYSADILNSFQANRVILITDQPHMLRSLLLFKSFGFEVIPHAVPLPPKIEAIDKTALSLREYIALFNYSLLGRFQHRTENGKLAKL